MFASYLKTKTKVMENQTLDNEKQLAIISEMIASTRNRLSEDGFHVIFWGILIVISCLAQYIMIQFFKMNHESNYVWLIMPAIGTPVSIIYGYKQSKEQKVKTLIDEFYGYIWIGFLISLLCVILISLAYKHSPTSFILVSMGFAVFIAGAVLKFKPLILGAVVFWISSFLYFYVGESSAQLLVFAGSVVLGYIIPGLMLRKEYKAQNHV